MTEQYPGGYDWQGGPPSGGYTTPPPVPTPLPMSTPLSTEPLISPNYNGWWSRGVSIAKRGWRPLAALQAVGVILALLVQAPVAAYAAIFSDRLDRNLGGTDIGQSLDLTSVFAVIGFGLLGLLVAVILTAMVTIATVHVGASIAVGAPVRIADALALALRAGCSCQ